MRFSHLTNSCSDSLKRNAIAQVDGLSKCDRHDALTNLINEHLGSLFEYVDRHYNHSNQSDPLAHNLVTSHYLSGAVRFPVDLQIYRRYEEITRWFVAYSLLLLAHEQLDQGQSAAEVFSRLFAKQRKEVPA